MQAYSSEEEQIQAIKDWWKDNGVAVVLGVVIGVGALVGWKGYQGYLDGRAEQASILYSQIMVAMETNQGEGVSQWADALLRDFASTPYATLGQFAAAKVAIGGDDTEDAVSRMRWIIANSKQPEFVALARLRLARLLLQQKDFAAVTRQLEADFPQSYAGRLAELRGDLYAAQGDYTLARSAYETALNDKLLEYNRQMIEVKYDDATAKSGNASAEELPDIEIKAAAQAESKDA